MLFKWLWLPLSSPLTRHNGQVFLGPPNLTIVQNPHFNSINPQCPLCKSWKPLHYGKCQVQSQCGHSKQWSHLPVSPKFLTGTLHFPYHCSKSTCSFRKSTMPIVQIKGKHYVMELAKYKPMFPFHCLFNSFDSPTSITQIPHSQVIGRNDLYLASSKIF
jgi:hypothetical protein